MVGASGDKEETAKLCRRGWGDWNCEDAGNIGTARAKSLMVETERSEEMRKSAGGPNTVSQVNGCNNVTGKML